ncbi:putative ribonuclease H-like domain-containing protein [Tanacetum coccineum]
MTKALVAQDGLGYDWSDPAKEGPTNFALMAYTSSCSSSSSILSNCIPKMKQGEAKTSVSKPKSVGEPLIEDWISDSEDENETEFKSKQRKPSFPKIEFVKSNEHVKTPRESVKKVENKNQAKYPRKNSQSPRGKRSNRQRCSRAYDTGNKSYLSGLMKKLMVDLLHLEEILKEVESVVKKNSVLFTDTECVVLSPDFKLLDENHVLLRVPRKDNKYNVDYKNIVPFGGLKLSLWQCPLDESKSSGIERLRAYNFKTTKQIAEAVNIACYVQNKVLLVKPYNKTLYELFRGRTPALSFMRPFGCHVTILNTLDYLGKFDGKSDEGFFVGYSLNSTEESIGAGHSSKETRSSQDYILMPLCKDGSLFDSSLKNASNDEPQPSSDAGKKDGEGICKESVIIDQEKSKNSTQGVNTAGPSINNELDIFSLGDNATLEATHDNFFGDETKVDMSNITTTYPVPSTPPNIRIHKGHSLDHVIGDIQSGVLTRRMTKTINKQGFIRRAQKGNPSIKRSKLDKSYAISASAVQVTIGLDLVDLPYGKRALEQNGIEAIRLFLAYASFKDFVVYQMDVKSAFLYGKIEEEVYVCQPPRFEDPEFPDKVYKLMHKKFQMSSMGELTFFSGLQVTQKDDGIFISQDKYIEEILKKFGFLTVKTASTPMETSKPLLKDAEAKDVDVHLYRSMIGSLMYLTASRPDIMFVVCACARFQVTPKGSHLHAVKRIFRYLKGQPKLGLWYPKDSPFDLEAYTDSDYAGASLDRKSTTGGCQFLRSRLISWQCRKQTIVATSTTEAEYVAAASCCGQVLWIQNQMLDYGYNFMNTKIFIDNESTICIVKNPVFHSKTKHIEIRHHFIRDSNEKKLIQMIKIHTYHNVADLLTKAFDVGRFQYLIARIGMLNL